MFLEVMKYLSIHQMENADWANSLKLLTIYWFSLVIVIFEG